MTGDNGDPNTVTPGDGKDNVLDDKVQNPADVDKAILVDKDGNEIPGSKVTVDKDGNITVAVPEGTPAGPAWVELYDKDGNLIGKIEVNVGDETGGTPSLTIPADSKFDLKTGGTTDLTGVVVKQLPEGATAELVDKDGNKIAGSKVEIGKDGSVKVTVPANAPLGGANVVFKDKDGKALADKGGKTLQVPVTIVKGDKVRNWDQLSQDQKGRCLASSIGGVGLPLLLLIPIGLAATTGVPGLEPAIKQFNAQIEAANIQIQQQLGIYNPQLAAQAAQVNAQLKEFGMNMVTGAAVLVLIPALIAGSVLTAKNCTPGDQIGSSE